MSEHGRQSKWHVVNQETAQKLTAEANPPGVIYPVGSNAVPEQLLSLPGAISYFVSSYASPVPLSPALTAGAEVAVIRTEGNTAKAYNYLIATSSNGQVYFNGPHKDFPAHHMPSSAPVAVESLFGNPKTNGKP